MDTENGNTDIMEDGTEEVAARGVEESITIKRDTNAEESITTERVVNTEDAAVTTERDGNMVVTGSKP